MVYTIEIYLHCVHLRHDLPSLSCTQLRDAVKYSFFLDSYNASATPQDDSTDTGSVCVSLISTTCMYTHLY